MPLSHTVKICIECIEIRYAEYFFFSFKVDHSRTEKSDLEDHDSSRSVIETSRASAFPRFGLPSRIYQLHARFRMRSAQQLHRVRPHQSAFESPVVVHPPFRSPLSSRRLFFASFSPLFFCLSFVFFSFRVHHFHRFLIRSVFFDSPSLLLAVSFVCTSHFWTPAVSPTDHRWFLLNPFVLYSNWFELLLIPSPRVPRRGPLIWSALCRESSLIKRSINGRPVSRMIT